MAGLRFPFFFIFATRHEWLYFWCLLSPTELVIKFVTLSVCLFVCLFVCLSVCLSSQMKPLEVIFIIPSFLTPSFFTPSFFFTSTFFTPTFFYPHIFLTHFSLPPLFFKFFCTPTFFRTKAQGESRWQHIGYWFCFSVCLFVCLSSQMNHHKWK